jgi:hypothetical protein
MLVCAFLLFAHETAGAVRIRHSPRPLISRREGFLGIARAQRAARTEFHVWIGRRCEKRSDEAIRSFLVHDGLLRFARNDDLWQ